MWFPIDDLGIADDTAVTQLIKVLTQLVHDGRVLYIHCGSGLGRTGTVAILLLLALYPKLTVPEAHRLVNQFKAVGRTGHSATKSMPEIDTQRDQVQRLADSVRVGPRDTQRD